MPELIFEASCGLYIFTYIFSFLIQHKCGYCGWLFRFNTNFVDHDCFKHYIEEVDHIYVDENNIMTIGMIAIYDSIYDTKVM